MPTKQKTQPLISVCVAGASCQRKWIDVLTRADAWGEQIKKTYEIIALPFHVSERSFDFLRRFADLLSHVRVLKISTRFEGAGIQEAMLDAQGLIRVYVPSEYVSDVYSYDAIETLFRSGADIVVCSRNDSDTSWQRRLFWNVARHAGIPFKAYPTSIAYSQKAVLQIFPHTTCVSRAMLTETLILAHAKQLNIRVMHQSEQQTRNDAQITLDEWADLMRLWWRNKRSQ